MIETNPNQNKSTESPYPQSFKGFKPFCGQPLEKVHLDPTN